MLKVIKGNDFALDFNSPEVATFDANWSGVWAIVAVLGGTALVSGMLTKSNDNTTLMLRMTPTQSDTLTAGMYMLVVQVSNASLGFKRDIVQESFMVEPKGIA